MQMPEHDGKERILGGITRNQGDLQKIEEVMESLRALRDEIAGIPNPQITADVEVIEGESINPKPVVGQTSEFNSKVISMTSNRESESAVAYKILRERIGKKAA